MYKSSTKSAESLWVPKWGLAMPAYSWAIMNTSYWSPLQAQYQNCTRGMRYTDDGCGASLMCKSAVLDFIHYVQNFHPSIKFTYKISPVSVEFLDILVNIKHGQFTTSIFYKPTDAHSDLYFHSSHHPISNTKASISYSQFLHL